VKYINLCPHAIVIVGDTVRDPEGHIIGCKNLVVNPA
jgi:hypothetical protein